MVEFVCLDNLASAVELNRHRQSRVLQKQHHSIDHGQAPRAHQCVRSEVESVSQIVSYFSNLTRSVNDAPVAPDFQQDEVTCNENCHLHFFDSLVTHKVKLTSTRMWFYDECLLELVRICI